MRDQYEPPASAPASARDDEAQYPAGNSIIDFLNYPSPAPVAAGGMANGMASTDAGSNATLEAHAPI